jgi:hypothetical protein
MSLSDTAEYWQDVKAYRVQKPVFTHKSGLDCGHFHKHETKKNKKVTCYACIKLLGTEPKCKVCKDSQITDEDWKTKDTHTFTCKGCNQVRTKIGKAPEPVNNDCECGGKMIIRSNTKTGEKFKGCSNYPACKKTQPCNTK